MNQFESMRINNKIVWGTVMTSLSFSNCCSDTYQRLLAVGGIHTFEKQTPCKLTLVEPEGAVKNLEWVDTLALEAFSEGRAEVICGAETIKLKIVTPTRLEITLVGESKLTEMLLYEPFKVQAWLYDNQGRQLEVGKFTVFEWTNSDIFQVFNDRSSGEFGFCDTCYGMHSFRAIKLGKGWIATRFGILQGMLTVEILKCGELD